MRNFDTKISKILLAVSLMAGNINAMEEDEINTSENAVSDSGDFMLEKLEDLEKDIENKIQEQKLDYVCKKYPSIKDQIKGNKGNNEKIGECVIEEMLKQNKAKFEELLIKKHENYSAQDVVNICCSPLEDYNEIMQKELEIESSNINKFVANLDKETLWKIDLSDSNDEDDKEFEERINSSIEKLGNKISKSFLGVMNSNIEEMFKKANTKMQNFIKKNPELEKKLKGLEDKNIKNNIQSSNNTQVLENNGKIMHVKDYNEKSEKPEKSNKINYTENMKKDIKLNKKIKKYKEILQNENLYENIQNGKMPKEKLFKYLNSICNSYINEENTRKERWFLFKIKEIDNLDNFCKWFNKIYKDLYNFFENLESNPKLKNVVKNKFVMKYINSWEEIHSVTDLIKLEDMRKNIKDELGETIY